MSWTVGIVIVSIISLLVRGQVLALVLTAYGSCHSSVSGQAHEADELETVQEPADQCRPVSQRVSRLNHLTHLGRDARSWVVWAGPENLDLVHHLFYRRFVHPSSLLCRVWHRDGSRSSTTNRKDVGVPRGPQGELG
jgi:hypothetical protein